MPNHNGRRYAVYFSPERGAPLERFGAAWLGRDAWTGEILPQPAVAGFSACELEQLTASPRLYGFHATLKAPFRLAPGRSEAGLIAQLREVASAQEPFLAPPLELATLGRFAALVLSGSCRPMDNLAAACVERFDDFRAPASDVELARRKESPLSERQLELLERWGYPYVLDEWRFHMSVTGSFDAATGVRARRAILPLAADFMTEFWEVDAICLFVQDSESSPFLVRERFPFRARTHMP